ncbi:hypothetical protein GCM10009846_19120 [Agrococcus versicolor]|uniref:Uncharacterized protein n=1 Tax=Agrococcus versicolor TaxID=501482 RepID=A0ABN3ASC8_9MICO
MIRIEPRGPRSFAILAFAGLLALAGCASSGDGDAAPAGDVTYEDSPLAQYLGVEADAYDEYAAQEADVQEAIAACMAEEGFEYVPVVLEAEDMQADVEAMDAEEWAAQHGYGVASGGEPIDDATMQEDPNAAYVESLSVGEQEAWSETLYGPVPSEDELAEDGAYAYDWQDAGCQGAADHEIRGDMLGGGGEEHEPLLEAMAALYDEAASDPAMVAVDAEWSECMADAGHQDLASPQAAYERAMEAGDALWGDGTTAPSDDAVADARDDEVELALADLGCQDETDHEQRRLAVQFALEDQFIEDHREELEAYRASFEQGS